jgi:hypothetical protein
VSIARRHVLSPKLDRSAQHLLTLRPEAQPPSLLRVGPMCSLPQSGEKVHTKYLCQSMARTKSLPLVTAPVERHVVQMRPLLSRRYVQQHQRPPLQIRHPCQLDIADLTGPMPSRKSQTEPNWQFLHSLSASEAASLSSSKEHRTTLGDRA